MKKLLIIIGAVCYVVAPDIFFGPVDDAIVLLGGIVYAIASSGGHSDPDFITMDKDF